ncbi:uncharacterized protein LOC135336323, partial [Halichondria panicea]|uniref:uncharacterized protein LOC135336323 n=1 Tax=Halichondria panicea TaxID=6063 RepID=UPI00312B6BCA
MPALLLQKPSSKSKAKEHASHLERRLKLWSEGQLVNLLYEGRSIQKQLHRNQPPQQNQDQEDRMAKKFAKLMSEGKVRAAMRLITNTGSTGLLNLENPASPNDPNSTKTVRDVLVEKHPQKQPPKITSITEQDYTVEDPHPIVFEEINGPLIRDTVLRMDGAAEPSGLDAASWKRLCTSFKGASNDLCEALAATARRICTTLVDPSGLTAFVAYRLIALDKCPGVRPIGIGEVSKRIINRAIARVLNEDIQQAAGPLQVCAGHRSGCEAAVHAMRQVLEDSETEAILMVDATNAFNSLNRQTALRNIHKLCPPLSKVLINTYREDINLFIGGETLLSQEGTTQGDPLAMEMYAIATNPIIKKLSKEHTKQVWFADDASASGDLHSLRKWWDTLNNIGPDYGYYPNASKTWLVVKNGCQIKANEMFGNTEVRISEGGQRYLGSAIGKQSFLDTYVQQKVDTWVEELKSLSSIATTQPHSAFAAFTHGFASKWTYLARTTPGIANLLKPLEETIRTV